jgi:hypothetical protein
MGPGTGAGKGTGSCASTARASARAGVRAPEPAPNTEVAPVRAGPAMALASGPACNGVEVTVRGAPSRRSLITILAVLRQSSSPEWCRPSNESWSVDSMRLSPPALQPYHCWNDL